MKANRRILVVDDNIEFCENVADVLELEGYETVGVHDGFKALEVIKDNGIDLVLMDIKMPMMDGVETFRKLRDISPMIPVIIVTAHAVEERISEALWNGAYGIFQKPLDFKKLICGIEHALPNGARIMVVDDNQELSTNLVDVLIENGYRGKAANDGSAAIQMARENKFDFIILDMKLPDMNGLEVYQSLRDIRPEGIVILITGHKGEMRSFVEEALQNNAYAYLEKPFDMDHLLEVIQGGLEKL